MESKLGALWRKPKTDRGPIAKGSLDFSRLEESDRVRLHEAFVRGEKVFITVWQNRHDEGDKKPDLTITLDKPYNPENKPKPATHNVDDRFNHFADVSKMVRKETL